ncbi:hypothetical protein Tco_1030328 [Tanacetum coccineum]|uniref:Uncharacterized protein n=1 Tax=Tanacetum coccineum TaxID=301880 RepID=A0ABQ5G5X2_9ASTR
MLSCRSVRCSSVWWTSLFCRGRSKVPQDTSALALPSLFLHNGLEACHGIFDFSMIPAPHSYGPPPEYGLLGALVLCPRFFCLLGSILSDFQLCSVIDRGTQVMCLRSHAKISRFRWQECAATLPPFPYKTADPRRYLLLPWSVVGCCGVLLIATHNWVLSLEAMLLQYVRGMSSINVHAVDVVTADLSHGLSGSTTTLSVVKVGKEMVVLCRSPPAPLTAVAVVAAATLVVGLSPGLFL